MVFKAVLFELGGTLMKTAPIQEIFKSILELYGVEVSADEILEESSVRTCCWSFGVE